MINEIKNLVECMVTWQGEGQDSGKRMLILRFSRCDRSCYFCDTQVKMRISSPFSMTIGDIQNKVYEEHCGVMITGGEPTFSLNYANTQKILTEIKASFFNIETNGCQLEKLRAEAPQENIRFVLSPKLFNADDMNFYWDLTDKIREDDRVYIKMVYEGTGLNNSYLDFLRSIDYPTSRIYLMPEGTTMQKLIDNSPKVFDACEKYKCNFSSRNHIIYNFI
jgi:organic radical activating enzyme